MNYKKILFPKNVDYIINKLNSNGFKAFIVGGCVRDSILGREPNDWDITTNALPEDIKRLFDRTFDTGIKHGTVSVLISNECYEVTTYRVDGEYSDNRRPDKVSFTSSLKEDLARRDFTINALAYHPNEGLIDYFDGQKDLAQRQIKAVGNANIRFEEDALRMLRAIRFSAQLGFSINKDTYNAIKEKSHLIEKISHERIRDELDKILLSPNPKYFDLLYNTNLLKHIIPEFIICYSTEQNNPYHIYNVAEHILHSVEYVKNTCVLRWTMLLHDIGKPLQKTTDDKGIDHFYGHQQVGADMARIILNRLKFDKESIKKITNLVANHDLDILDNEKSIKKAINKVGEDLFRDFIEVKKADAMSQNIVYLEDRLKMFENVIKIYEKIKLDNQCLKKSDMAVNGYDLISLGMEPGKELSSMLNYLLECVLENPELNNKEKLIDIAKEKLN